MADKERQQGGQRPGFTWKIVENDDMSEEERVEINALFDLMSWAGRKADEIWYWGAAPRAEGESSPWPA